MSTSTADGKRYYERRSLPQTDVAWSVEDRDDVEGWRRYVAPLHDGTGEFHVFGSIRLSLWQWRLVVRVREDDSMFPRVVDKGNCRAIPNETLVELLNRCLIHAGMSK